MKNVFSAVFPYILAGASVLAVKTNASAQNTVSASDVKNVSTSDMHFANYTSPLKDKLPQMQRILAVPVDKAGRLVNTYVDNALDARAKLASKKGTRGYASAVRAEIPGAPVGQHCLYSQYYELGRALNAYGDTIRLIPAGARASCREFKRIMSNKYRGTEYTGCIYDDMHMFESDAEYNAALDKYIASHDIDRDDFGAMVRARAAFAARNFSADRLNPGSILIVPRKSGQYDKFHAIMYVGRGRNDGGRFVADANGRHMYCGFNNESLKDLFVAFDTSIVFAADMLAIARVEYDRELSRIESMSRDQLIGVLDKNYGMSPVTLDMPTSELRRMVISNYYRRGPGDVSRPQFGTIDQYTRASHTVANVKKKQSHNRHRATHSRGHRR